MQTTRTAVRFRGLDHIGVTVPDLEKAIAFYLDAFGGEVLYRMGPLDSRDMPHEDGRDWTANYIDVPDALVSFAGVRLAGGLLLEIYQYQRPAGASWPPRNSDPGGHHIALRVDDVESAAEHLRAKGCRLMRGPIVVPGGPLLGSRSWYFADPWENYFELMEYERMAFMSEDKGAGRESR
jgi:glyoxylase I family protein